MLVSTTPIQHAVLHNISWHTYECMLADLDCRPIRLTYDGGTLEIMSPSQPHERTKRYLGRMLETLTEEFDIPIASGGSTTFKHKGLGKGIEPDECYWIQNEARMRGHESVDLAVDLPPDLAIEVDVSHSSINRLTVYAALGIAEVWQHREGKLHVLLLNTQGRCTESPTSRAFPWLPITSFAAKIHQPGSVNETTWIRSFRAWVQTLKRG